MTRSHVRPSIVSGVVLSIAVAIAFTDGFKASAQRPARSARGQTGMKSPPRPGPSKPFTLPSPREIKLDNGLTVAMIQDHRAPMVTIALGLRAGGVDDPPGQPGLAEATADLITQGAGTRTPEQLAREIETLGGRIEASATDDFTELSGSVVSENAERMLEITSDILLRPTFPESEIALYKSNRVEHLTVQRQEPAFLVSEHFNRVVFGTHPYAFSAPTPESVEGLDRKRLEGFYRSNYTPIGALLVIVGDFDDARMEGRVKALFGAWKASAPSSKDFPEMPERTKRMVYLMDRPGSDQADFRIGNLAVARPAADYYPLLLASTILGGGTSSRLFLGIRERLGYAYDVSSSVSAPRQRGTFFGAAETRTEVTVAAIKEMLAEFSRIRNLKVTPIDLRNAKNYLNGLFSLSLSTQGGIAGKILQSRMLDLPKDYMETYRAKVEAVTADQVQEAASKYILTERPAIVVVGDAAKLKRQLESLGPVEVVDIEGKPQKTAIR
jgi:zinc protease